MLRKEDTLLTVTCAVIAIGSVAGALVGLFRGELGADGLDGIFLLIVCLLFAVAFGAVALQAARQSKIREFFKLRKAAPPAENREADVAQSTNAARSA